MAATLTLSRPLCHAIYCGSNAVRQQFQERLTKIRRTIAQTLAFAEYDLMVNVLRESTKCLCAAAWLCVQQAAGRSCQYLFGYRKQRAECLKEN